MKYKYIYIRNVKNNEREKVLQKERDRFRSKQKEG